MEPEKMHKKTRERFIKDVKKQKTENHYFQDFFCKKKSQIMREKRLEI